MVKSLIAAAFIILLTAEKPKVHSDFYFGTYPTHREAEKLMQDEKARLLTVAYHVGWSTEKLAKELKEAKIPSTELKLSSTEFMKLSDEMEDSGLFRNPDDYQLRPGMVVIRDKDFEKIVGGLTLGIQEFTKVVQENWNEIETFVSSLPRTESLSRERVLYEFVVSGILLGGLVDAFWEDNTMMLRPPRRGKNDRYYAWLIESNPELAGKLKREIRESSGYRIVSIGETLPEERLNPEDLRGKASVYDEAEARKYRTFVSVFSRDKMLPFFKTRRNDILKLGAQIEAGRRIAATEFFAWYYFTVANGVVKNLIDAKLITPPDKYYTYAVFAPVQ